MADFLNQDFGSESEDDDFNPQPEVDEEDAGNASENDAKPQSPSRADDAGGDADENDDDEDADNSTTKKPSQDANAEDENEDGEEEEGGGGDEEEDEEDEEDEDEDEDEEDEEVVGRSRKRRKRDARMQFIDVEAEVDDEDEEELEEEDDLVQEEVHPDDLLEMPPGAENDERRHRELDRQRELAESLDAEKAAERLRERYGKSRAAAVDSFVVPKHALLPSVDDPGIWAVKCRPGKEGEVVAAILKRFEQRATTKNPLNICSAFERGTTVMTGYVYIEAPVQAAVFDAIDGLPNVWARNDMKLIDVKDRPSLLHINTSKKQVDVGDYVRMKRPARYAGDIGVVEAVEPNEDRVTVKLVPRIDDSVDDDINAPIQADGKRKRPGFAKQTGPRPQQKLFTYADAVKNHGKHLVAGGGLSRNSFRFKGDDYVDGFLIKDFKTSYLETENVRPTLQEIQAFATRDEDGTEAVDLLQLAASNKAAASGESFLPGDKVEIYQGEQKGISGKTVSVRGDIVTLKVTSDLLKGQTIEAPVRTLRKFFRVGDHVKVISGSKYVGEVGFVAKIKDDRVIFNRDGDQQEITVFSKDLREAADSNSMAVGSKYDLYDLVQLDQATVGIIVKVDTETLRVLDQNGNLRTVLHSQVANKMEKRRNAVGTDRDGSEIRIGDTVKEYSGENRQGTVLDLHRSYVFVQNRSLPENMGVFVVRNSNVTTVAAKGGKVNAAPDFSKMNPALLLNGGPNAKTMMLPPRTMGRDKFIGKTVTVRKGPHKGLLGIVKDTTDDSARVELHSKNKIITVSKEFLSVKDPITGQSQPLGKFGGPPRTGAPPPGRYGGATPGRESVWGGRTPAPGNRTPAWQAGGRTPAWGGMSGGRTPAFPGADGSRTAYGDGSRTAYGDGSRTSYGGGDGNRTAYGGSTWNANARTPYNPSGYGNPSGESAWAAGSKTPAYHSSNNSSSNPWSAGGRTPAYHSTSGNGTSYGSAPTPAAAFDAPTPGAYTAPTPGDTSAATPKGFGGYGQYNTPGAAPTPGAYPETPGAWAADTPAGGDDGPRYE